LQLDLTGSADDQWYFSSHYRKRGPAGSYEAITKHPVENSAEMESNRIARLQLQRLADRVLTDDDGEVTAEALIDKVLSQLGLTSPAS
jgi:hypothetical protein